MTTPTPLHLADLISASSDDADFDLRLRQKLDLSSDEKLFNVVRRLFQESATALEKELAQTQYVNIETSCPALSHWIPGRIEVMGKHTDYAGGNSLVCTTEGLGMAITSTMAPSVHRTITIVSVLAGGMEHHAVDSAAPFVVNGKTVVRHTINVDDTQRNTDTAIKDWRIYPMAAVRRMEKNFGLSRHSATLSGPARHYEQNGYHIVISIASNLPPASGLSTSSALITGLFLVLDSHLDISSSELYRQAIGNRDDDETIYNLSTYLGNIENGSCYTRYCTEENKTIALEGTLQGDGVGTFGGSEDHAAILMGNKRKLRLLSFCPTRPAKFQVNDFDGLVICNAEDNDKHATEVNQKSEFVLPEELVFVIAYSGARAEKAGQGTDASIGYNYASDMAGKAATAYISCSTTNEKKKLQTLADIVRYERKKQGIKHISSCRDRIHQTISNEMLSVECDRVDDCSNLLVQRFAQFYEESELLVPAAAYCLAKDRLDMLGPIVDSSHRNAVNILKNQIAETAWLPLWTRGIEDQLNTKPKLYVDGCESNKKISKNAQRITALASSAFGAGFGGSCWALVHQDEAETFLKQWRSAYDQVFPANVSREFFITQPGSGALAI